jgi:hypothetical protein
MNKFSPQQERSFGYEPVGEIETLRDSRVELLKDEATGQQIVKKVYTKLPETIRQERAILEALYITDMSDEEIVENVIKNYVIDSKYISFYQKSHPEEFTFNLHVNRKVKFEFEPQGDMLNYEQDTIAVIGQKYIPGTDMQTLLFEDARKDAVVAAGDSVNPYYTERIKNVTREDMDQSYHLFDTVNSKVNAVIEEHIKERTQNQNDKSAYPQPQKRNYQLSTFNIIVDYDPKADTIYARVVDIGANLRNALETTYMRED